jgi:hypothetical protein
MILKLEVKYFLTWGKNIRLPNAELPETAYYKPEGIRQKILLRHLNLHLERCITPSTAV